MENKKLRFAAQTLIIASVYIILTFISSIIGLSSGAIQIRLSEILTVLPIFTPAAIPGLFIGCVISNITSDCIPADVILGSLSTLLSAFCTYGLRKFPPLGVLPPIIINSLSIACILKYAYEYENHLVYYMMTVGLGEFICCGALGMILMFILEKNSEK